MDKQNEKRFETLVMLAGKMKMIIVLDREIPDKKLSQRLGISFSQLQAVKDFCRLNGMSVNKPKSNKYKKDLTGIKNEK